MRERGLNPYWELFKGKEVYLSELRTENPMAEYLGIKMITQGVAVGQWTLFEPGELLIWMPCKRRMVNLAKAA